MVDVHMLDTSCWVYIHMISYHPDQYIFYQQVLYSPLMEPVVSWLPFNIDSDTVTHIIPISGIRLQVIYQES